MTVESTQLLRSQEIECERVSLLIPANMVIRVLPYAIPVKAERGPAWFLGSMPWHGHRLPLISFDAFLGEPPTSRYRRLVVVRALGGHPGLPGYAIAAMGLPKLVTLSEHMLLTLNEIPPDGVTQWCDFNGIRIALPVVDRLVACFFSF